MGVFAEFHKGAHSGFRVEEGDVEAFCAFAGCLVNRAAALFFCFGQGVGNAVGYCECHVLYAAATAVVGNEFGDGAVFSCAFEKFDFGLADLEEGCAHFLVCHFFYCEAFKTENVFVERNGFVEGGYRDADVFDMGNIHGNMI